MDNVKCFYRDEEGFHQINVSKIVTHNHAIQAVKQQLIDWGFSENVHRRVLAVVK